MNAKTAFVPLLTNRQKASLCQMARQAWIEAGSDLDFSDWRRQQQLKVVGKASLTQCNQDDYRPLANHFVAIKNGAESDPVPTGGADWPTGDAPQKLWDAEVGPQLRKIGKLLGPARSWNYAHALASRIAKVDHLDWCTPLQLRKIIAALNFDRKRKERDSCKKTS